jgi:hypothetical protein
MLFLAKHGAGKISIQMLGEKNNKVIYIRIANYFFSKKRKNILFREF